MQPLPSASAWEVMTVASERVVIKVAGSMRLLLMVGAMMGGEPGVQTDMDPSWRRKYS